MFLFKKQILLQICKNSNVERNIRKKTFEIGKKIRVSNYENVFEKAYTPNWTKELFTVKQIKNTKPQLHIFVKTMKINLILVIFMNITLRGRKF